MAEPIGYFVVCPFCGAKVPLPPDEPDELFKVAQCLDCSRSFDYDPDEVQEEPSSQANAV